MQIHSALRKIALPGTLVLGIGVGATLLDAGREPIPELGAQSVVENTETVVEGGAYQLSSAFREASSRALPGVVFVEVEGSSRLTSEAERFRGTPFEDFFRMHPALPERGESIPRSGSGSGFIVHEDGYIMTNNHVVANMDRVMVTLTDKREFVATVVGRDPNTDVAVLKIEAEGLTPVSFGNSDALAVGDWVLALGYPLSLGETVTAGIVSAKGKSINILGRNEGASAPLEHFIQTDAAINMGNSGGPLVNLRGEVVGINTAIASPTGTYSGYGFAVPIQIAKRVADDLIRYGAVHRPKLGIQIKDVEPADVEIFDLPSVQGSVVASLPEGPAKDAGMELGDVVVSVDGRPIKDTGDLMERVAMRRPGETVELGVIRYGEKREFEVRLASFETPGNGTARAASKSTESVEGRIGFRAYPITPDLASRLQLERTEGLVVAQVDPRSGAPRALERIVLERVNGEVVRTPEDLERVSRTIEPGSAVSVIGSLPDGSRTILNYRLRK